MSKDLIGLIFSLCWTGLVAVACYLICFKGHAKKMGREIINFHKKWGTYHKSYDLMFQPVVLKIIISIFLVFGFFFLYSAIRAVLN